MGGKICSDFNNEYSSIQVMNDKYEEYPLYHEIIKTNDDFLEHNKEYNSKKCVYWACFYNNIDVLKMLLWYSNKNDLGYNNEPQPPHFDNFSPLHVCI